MTDVEVRDLVAAERRDLAAVLAGLPAQAWDSPTLCVGWRVREVVAHMTMPFRYSGGRVLLEMVKARGNFNKMADRTARRDAAALSADELTACMRDNAEHPWKPPGGGPAGALSHDVIHGLDITVGLGLDRQVPVDRLRTVLDGASPKQVKYSGSTSTASSCTRPTWTGRTAQGNRCTAPVRTCCSCCAAAGCRRAGYAATRASGSAGNPASRPGGRWLSREAPATRAAAGGLAVRRTRHDSLHGCVEVRRVHLPDELTTPTARWQHVRTPRLVVPHRDDPRDAVLTGGDHRRDRLCSAQNPVPDPVSMHTPE